MIIYRNTKGSPLSNTEVDTNFRTVGLSAAEFVIDAGGSPLISGLKGYLEIPFDCNVTAWKLVSPQSGNAVVEIYSDTYAAFGANTSMIGAGVKPSLVAANKNTAAPSGWTTVAIPAGNLLGFYLVSVSGGLLQLSVSLKLQKT